jgi:hypothetical protein
LLQRVYLFALFLGNSILLHRVLWITEKKCSSGESFSATQNETIPKKFVTPGKAETEKSGARRESHQQIFSNELYERGVCAVCVQFRTAPNFFQGIFKRAARARLMPRR